jgi:hypothetical protein
MSKELKYVGTATVSYDGMGESYGLVHSVYMPDGREGDEYEVYIKFKPKPAPDPTKFKRCCECSNFTFNRMAHSCLAGKQSMTLYDGSASTKILCESYFKGSPKRDW